METKYSVLMSVYKNEKPKYLDQSLQSMVNQTYLADEIVIVKDGPITEELEQVINKYIVEYKDLIKVVPIKENIGLGKALDVGFKHCSNELIARMDTDDISLPERCELQIKRFESDPNLSIVGTMVDEFHDTPDKIVSSRIVPTDNASIVEFMKRRSPFNHPTVMYKKSDVIRSGGYGKMRRKQDLDLFSRMINNGCKAENINQSLVLFRSNEDNLQRRKSWSYVSSYIAVQFEIFKRGHCSLWDLSIVIIGQIFMYIAPTTMVRYFSNRYLRKT